MAEDWLKRLAQRSPPFGPLLWVALPFPLLRGHRKLRYTLVDIINIYIYVYLVSLKIDEKLVVVESRSRLEKL